jgi:creatinine amidohydrolase
MANRKSLKLENLTWVEAGAVLKEYEVVMIPLGARTKEHGPHLPLNNDWILAEYLAGRVATEVPVVIMPTLQYGYYPAFLEYPGTVSLNQVTFKEMVKDICISMSGYGVKKFYILNTGVSTMRGLAPAAEELAEQGITMKFTNILEIGKATEKEISQQEGGTHADEIETSMMLYIKPDIVDMSKAVSDYHPRPGYRLSRDPNAPDIGAYSASGTYGDATLATLEKGQVVVEAKVHDIIQDIKSFLEE